MSSPAPATTFAFRSHASQDALLGFDGLIAPVPTADRGGAFDALANYWITKITYEDRKDTIGVPEFNLDYSASEAFHTYLAGRELPAATAFDLAIRIAGIIERRPLHADREIRVALETTLKDYADFENAPLKPIAEAFRNDPDEGAIARGERETVDEANIAPMLDAIAVEYGRIVGDFSSEAASIAKTAEAVRKAQESGSELSSELLEQVYEFSNAFCVGAQPKYDFEEIGAACGELWNVMAVLTGRMKRDGSLGAEPNGE